VILENIFPDAFSINTKAMDEFGVRRVCRFQM
jgi:glucose-6-phosphate isomerase